MKRYIGNISTIPAHGIYMFGSQFRQTVKKKNLRGVGHLNTNWM